MSGFAGALRERVTFLVRVTTRDDLGGLTGAWADDVIVWAAVRPDGAAPLDGAGVRLRWAVTMRSGVAVPRRLRWLGRMLAVRWVERDPALPDRIVLRTEETR